MMKFNPQTTTTERRYRPEDEAEAVLRRRRLRLFDHQLAKQRADIDENERTNAYQFVATTCTNMNRHDTPASMMTNGAYRVVGGEEDRAKRRLLGPNAQRFVGRRRMSNPRAFHRSIERRSMMIRLRVRNDTNRSGPASMYSFVSCSRSTSVPLSPCRTWFGTFRCFAIVDRPQTNEKKKKKKKKKNDERHGT
jgi:hypothetical protein